MKNLILSLIAGSLLFLGCNKQSGQPEWQKKYNDPKQVREMFANPPMFYAPHTFWFWDDTLNPEHISNMAEEMCKQGLNPGYAHGRGEATEEYTLLPREEWVSEKWFDAFSRSVKNAENHNMSLGYCDEYWWPSGQAAGRVIKEHPELRAQYLDWKRYTVKGNSSVQYDSVDFAVAAKLDQKLIDQSTLTIIGEGKNIKWTAPAGDWVVYTYAVKYHSGFDGGEVNYLDTNLMNVFIPMVHEKYAQHFGNKLGYSIPGSFVDNEGDFGYQMAWSDYLASQYKEVKKRDIRLWLPLLTEKDKDGIYAKARCDWYDVVTDVYIRCYFNPVVKWLQEHNMYYISNLWEESIQWQAQAMGDFMRVTRVATMPGTDCLEMRSQDVHDFKEVGTVAELEDRPFMSEIMGVAGWGQTPAMIKQTVNAVISYGVTHIVPHGINTNRKIETIPYPADWFTENPYWNYFHLWTDFTRRAAFVNRQGKLQADVLLINPLETAFALSETYFSEEHTTLWDPIVNEVNDAYSNAMRSMLHNNIDYLVADKYYLNKSVIASKDQSAVITINDHEFAAIVLPPMYIISREVAARIVEFAEKGGTVVLLGRIPAGSPEVGAKDEEIVKQMEKLLSLPSVINAGKSKDCMQALVDGLTSKIVPNIIVADKKQLLYTQTRKIGNSLFYWISNNNDHKVTADLLLKQGKGLAEKWNCETGAIVPVAYKATDHGANVQIPVEAYEGFWLVFDPAGTPLAMNTAEPVLNESVVEGAWMVKPADDTLEHTTAKVLFTSDNTIDEKKLTQPLDSTWQNMSFVHNKKGKYPWTAPTAVFKETNTSKYFRYRIGLTEKPAAAVINVCGDDDEKIWVNGQLLAPGLNTAAYNKTYAYDIAQYLVKGENVVAIQIINGAGLGTLMVEGWYEMPDGKVGSINMSRDWKESYKITSDWTNTSFNDKAWNAVSLADHQTCLERQGISDKPVVMKYNSRSVNENAAVYWRMIIPAGAVKLVLEDIFRNSQVYIDGVKTAISGTELVLPATAKELSFAWQSDNINTRLNTPLKFICTAKAERNLGSWYDYGYLQYTGYVDYEKTVTVADIAGVTKLDLGKVKYMAEIWVNGQKAGESLWGPFVFDISKQVKQGENTIKVRIGNLMVNKLWVTSDLGQLRLWSWKGAPDYAKFDGGLFGPVKLISEK